MPIIEFREQVGDVLKESLSEFLVGASEDLHAFGRQLAADAMDAVLLDDAEKRQKILGELEGQLQVLAELHRLKLVRHTWNVVEITVRSVIETVIAAIPHFKES